jgi:flavin reductase (DIM6/NTAB) family NADH-FMN oxidoreductase RutF
VTEPRIESVFDLIEQPVWIVTSAYQQQRNGLVATFVASASLLPAMPRVVLAIAPHHHTWELLERRRAFNLHLLGKDQLSLVWRFGLSSGRDVDKFSGLHVDVGENGCPLLSNSLAWLECNVEMSVNAGDRTLYVAEVAKWNVRPGQSPLTSRDVFERAGPEHRARLLHELAKDRALDREARIAWKSGRPAGPTRHD